MRAALASLVAMLTVFFVSTPAFAQAAPLPTGTWKLNGNGFEGQLVIKSVVDGKVEGTIYGQRIVGMYDARIRRLNFLRLQDPKDPTSFQSWKGYLFLPADGKQTHYVLAGTVMAFGAPRHRRSALEAGWYAQLTQGKK